MIEQGFDVTVVGNVGIDTNVYFYGNDIDFSVESNFTENVDCVGQSGGYSSRGFAQLGKKIAFIDPTGTSRSINFMCPDGRRKNFCDGKDHMHLQPDMGICKAV